MPGGFSSGFSSGFGADAGTFRFLVDHYFNNEIIPAGTIKFMSGIWSPTPEVDPLDLLAVQTFYSMGPQMSLQIISRWTNQIIAAPVTYWYQLPYIPPPPSAFSPGFSPGFGSGPSVGSPNYWALTGLGSDQVLYPPIHAIIGRL